jgi:hypothetical protein
MPFNRPWRVYSPVGFLREGLPAGVGNTSTFWPVTDGGIRLRSVGQANATLDAVADALLSGSSAGAATTALSVGAIKPLGVLAAAGLATTAGAALADARVSSHIRIGFQPSAEDIVGNLLDTQEVSPGVTVREALAGLSAIQKRTALIPALV